MDKNIFNKKNLIIIGVSIAVIIFVIIAIVIGIKLKKTVNVSTDTVSEIKEVAEIAKTDDSEINNEGNQNEGNQNENNSNKGDSNEENKIWKIDDNQGKEENKENVVKEENKEKEKEENNNNNETNLIRIEETKDEKKEDSNKKESEIYLTFDDGPTTTSTPKILEILKKENVNATFFVINYDEEGEKLIKQEYENGNTVAIHGFSHDYKKIYASDEAYMDNLNKLQAKINNSIGVKPIATRFPGGSSNTISRRYSKKIMSRLVESVQKAGYRYYDWNVDSDDAGSAKNKKDIYNNVTKGLKKNRANVVLMHDFSNNHKTIDALENIIKYGKENGYVFKAITNENDPKVHHGVNN